MLMTDKYFLFYTRTSDVSKLSVIGYFMFIAFRSLYFRFFLWFIKIILSSQVSYHGFTQFMLVFSMLPYQSFMKIPNNAWSSRFLWPMVFITEFDNTILTAGLCAVLRFLFYFFCFNCGQIKCNTNLKEAQIYLSCAVALERISFCKVKYSTYTNQEMS